MRIFGGAVVAVQRADRTGPQAPIVASVDDIPLDNQTDLLLCVDRPLRWPWHVRVFCPAR